MKKLLSILMAIVLMFSVVACSIGGKELTGEEEAKKTVESFMKAVINFEFDKIGEYFNDEDDIPENVRNLNVAAVFEAAMNEMPAELSAYSEDFEGLFSEMLDKMKSKFAYEIKEVAEGDNKDEYVVTTEITMPDLDDVDFESVLSESLDEDAMNTVILELATSGKITENSTEEEVLELLIPKFIDLCKDAISDIEIEVSTEETELTVVKTEDGKWLIDAEKSNLD